MPNGGEGLSSAEEDLSAAEADVAVSSAEEDLSTTEVEIMVSSAEEDLSTAEVDVAASSAEEDLSAAEAEVFSSDTLDNLFLRGGSIVNPGTRGELDRLLRYCRSGGRLNICERMPSSMGERTGTRPAEGTRFGVGLLFALALLPLALIWLSRVVPGWPARSGSVELGTSRVVGKQGERGKAKLSTRQIRLETR